MEGWNLTGTSSGSFIDFANAMAGSEAAGQSAAGKDTDALSVSQAVEMAANALDAIPQLTVIGEVTGFRGPNARSGHCYFQIKDDASAVDCKIWRGVYSKRAFDLRDGLQVQFTGSFDLYKPTGRMSFIARSFSLAGEGLLRQQVAALAEKLRREERAEEKAEEKENDNAATAANGKEPKAGSTIITVSLDPEIKAETDKDGTPEEKPNEKSEEKSDTTDKLS